MNTKATPPQIFRILLSAVIGLALTLLALVQFAGSAQAEDITPLPPVITTGGHLGTSYANYDIGGTFLGPLAYNAGSRWDRVDFSWLKIQPTKTTRNWDPHDTLVARQTGAGLDIIGILMNTPSWAADTDRCSLAAQSYVLPSQLVGRPALAADTALDYETWKCPPKGLYLPWYDPNNLWGAFVHDTVSHYSASGVHVWEMWNEPDMVSWFWRGSIADYAQLLRVGYQAAKAADPEATVLFAGLAYWANPGYYVAVLDALKTMPDCAANNYCFDAMSLHLYSNVYQIGPVAAEIRTNMAIRVGTHPIWLTETGAPLWDESPIGALADRLNLVTAEEASAYVVQAFAESRAVGIEKFVFFRTHDANMSEYFGLIRNDLPLSFRPAYPAFQTAAEYLYGENQVTGPFDNGGVRRITLWGTPRGRIDVLWNTTSTTIAYGHPAFLPQATLVTHRGTTSTIPAAGGRFTVTLAPATANTGLGGTYLVGGSPILLIQGDTVAPTSALRPLPDPHYGAAVTLAWDVVDVGTGYWYAEVERASVAGNGWSLVAGLSQTRGTATTVDVVPGAGRWHYRVRVRDNAGNWGMWPSDAEVAATVWVTRTVGLSVTVFLDEDANGLRDPNEVSATTAALTWRGGDGAIIAQTVGPTWQITRTVDEGQHTLLARVPGYIAAPYAFQITSAPDPILVSISVGLKPVVGTAYLPLITRQH